MHILLLFDMSQLWDSCRTQYGKRARVDFKGLLEKVKTKKTDTISAVAFIANHLDKNQDNLIKKLNEYGIETVAKQVAEGQPVEFASEMLAVLSQSQGFDLVVVGGGDKNLIPVLEAANQTGKQTMLIGFCVGVQKEAACVADDVKLLQKSDTIIQ